MSSVALIGPDGAGKTTIARRLVAEPDLDARYLYMGVSVESSNVCLPTTRLARRLKRALGRREDGPGDGAGGPAGAGADEARKKDRRGRWWDPRGGRLWAAARLANRVAEEWYRQLLAGRHQLRGRLVVYDRHYLFDYRGSDIEHRNRTPSKRIHRWLLEAAYPRPDLVICLDAPGEVLFARKGEKSPEALEARRRAFLRQGREMESFVRVDATRSPEEVYREVLDHVRALRHGEGAAPASTGRSR